MSETVKVSDKDIFATEIIVKYDDGTEKSIKKGAIMEMKDLGTETKFDMEFANISGEEAVKLFEGMLRATMHMLGLNN